MTSRVQGLLGRQNTVRAQLALGQCHAMSGHSGQSQTLCFDLNLISISILAQAINSAHLAHPSPPQTVPRKITPPSFKPFHTESVKASPEIHSLFAPKKKHNDHDGHNPRLQKPLSQPPPRGATRRPSTIHCPGPTPSGFSTDASCIYFLFLFFNRNRNRNHNRHPILPSQRRGHQAHNLVSRSSGQGKGSRAQDYQEFAKGAG